MNGTVVVLVVAVIAAAIVIGLIAAFARSRAPRLRALPEESRDRFARSWGSAETQFIDDPRGAVTEADKIVVMILSERGATLDDDRGMPREMRLARESAASDQGRQGTEGMRMAMVHYKRIVDDAVGADHMRGGEQRREVAS